jgi:hypothetical protein
MNEDWFVFSVPVGISPYDQQKLRVYPVTESVAQSPMALDLRVITIPFVRFQRLYRGRQGVFKCFGIIQGIEKNIQVLVEFGSGM